MLHGDLSSGNIMINRATASVKLIDFEMSVLNDSYALPYYKPDFTMKEVAEAIDENKRIRL